MCTGEGKTLPSHGDWLDVKEAAALMTRLGHEPVTDTRLRRWLREGHRRVAPYDVERWGQQYFVERESILSVAEENALKALRVIEEERGKK